jgi:glycosyltransferase involved in cell wall biosynthesis
MKVFLIGPYPPPYGGISVAIERLRDRLQQSGVECYVYDTSRTVKQVAGVIPAGGGTRWLIRLCLTADADVIHYQASSWKMRAMVGLLPWRRAKTVISVQGSSLLDSWAQGNSLRRSLIRFALRRTSYVILANPDHVPFIRSLGIPETRSAVIPAYIPPVVREEDDAQISDEIRQFWQAHTPLLLANGAVAFYRGEDLYGLDMMVDLIGALRPSFPRIGLVVPLRPITESAQLGYWETLRDRASAAGLAESILWVPGGVPALHPLIRASQLFLRPTNTDGDAVSIREALYFQVPVVASDAAPRPDGSVLFRSRDVGDFVAQVRSVLSGTHSFRRADSPSAFDQIWRIYHELAGTRKGE